MEWIFSLKTNHKTISLTKKSENSQQLYHSQLFIPTIELFKQQGTSGIMNLGIIINQRRENIRPFREKCVATVINWRFTTKIPPYIPVVSMPFVTFARKLLFLQKVTLIALHAQKTIAVAARTRQVPCTVSIIAK